MPDSDRIDVELVTQPCASNRHRGRHVRYCLDRKDPVSHGIAARAAGAQPRAAADAVDLALDLPSQPALAFHRKDLELHAGRAGIDDEDRIHGAHAAAIGVLLRRASACSAATAADAIRDQLKQSGLAIEDGPDGPRWTLGPR